MDITRALVLLGVTQGSTQEEVKRAYRRLSRTKHPDMGGDPTEYIELTEAYSFLLREGTTPVGLGTALTAVKMRRYTHKNLFEFKYKRPVT